MALAPASLSLQPCSGFSLSQPKTHILSKYNSNPSPSFPLQPHSTTPFPLLSTKSLTLPITRAISLDSPPPTQLETRRKYYFLVANAKFMLDEEEHFQELMKERARMYGERNKEVDFWLVVEPKFLDKFPNLTKRLKRPAVALVSTDANWITYMKLRLDRVLAECFEADSFDEALASDPVDLQFEKPEKWVAPYPKYEGIWWETFLPKATNKTTT